MTCAQYTILMHGFQLVPAFSSLRGPWRKDRSSRNFMFRFGSAGVLVTCLSEKCRAQPLLPTELRYLHQGFSLSCSYCIVATELTFCAVPVGIPVWGLLVDECRWWNNHHSNYCWFNEVRFVNLEIQFTYVVLAVTLKPRLVRRPDCCNGCGSLIDMHC
jgi:hypothetical protein